jgi:hypothetical protein
LYTRFALPHVSQEIVVVKVDRGQPVEISFSHNCRGEVAERLKAAVC